MDKTTSNLIDSLAEKLFNNMRADTWDDVELIDEEDESTVSYQYEFPHETTAQFYVKKLEKHPVDCGDNIKYSVIQDGEIVKVTFTTV